MVTPYGERKPVLELHNVEGDALPYRLAGSSEQSWQANVLPVARAYDAGLRDKTIKPWSSWPSVFFFSVRTGDGKIAHAKASQFDAGRLIADVFVAQSPSTSATNDDQNPQDTNGPG
jgi:hypothetical protein